MDEWVDGWMGGVDDGWRIVPFNIWTYNFSLLRTEQKALSIPHPSFLLYQSSFRLVHHTSLHFFTSYTLMHPLNQAFTALLLDTVADDLHIAKSSGQFSVISLLTFHNIRHTFFLLNTFFSWLPGTLLSWFSSYSIDFSFPVSTAGSSISPTLGLGLPPSSITPLMISLFSWQIPWPHVILLQPPHLKKRQWPPSRCSGQRSFF